MVAEQERDTCCGLRFLTAAVHMPAWTCAVGW